MLHTACAIRENMSLPYMVSYLRETETLSRVKTSIILADVLKNNIADVKSVLLIDASTLHGGCHKICLKTQTSCLLCVLKPKAGRTPQQDVVYLNTPTCMALALYLVERIRILTVLDSSAHNTLHTKKRVLAMGHNESSA